MVRLEIGNVKISLSGLSKDWLPTNTLLFQSEFENCDLSYHIHVTNFENFKIQSNPVLLKKNDLIVFKKSQGLESRLFIFPENNVVYGYYEEFPDYIDVYFNEYFLEYLKIDTVFYSLLALERHLSRKNKFIFHCSYLDFNGDAFLFSGPSGIGKSTQTNRWMQLYPGMAKVLNGDKCLLSEENGIFYAEGWPTCGSSAICHNEKRRIKAIILLQQTLANQVIQESTFRHFKRILEQLTVNYWNPDFRDRSMSFSERITQSITCFTYGCNMSDDAVYFLKQQLVLENEEK